MKILKILFFVLLFITVLFGKIDQGSYKLQEFKHSSKDSFDVNIEIKYKIWTIMGKPVIEVKSKYTLGDIAYIDGKRYKIKNIPKEIVDNLGIYDLNLKSTFETKKNIYKYLRINTDPGVMSKLNEWSFNKPISLEWNNLIMYKNGKYLNKEEAIESYNNLYRLSFETTKNESMSNRISFKYDVLSLKKYLNKQNSKLEIIYNNEKNEIERFKAEKKSRINNKNLPKILEEIWVDENTRLMWQNESYTKNEINKFNQNYETYNKVGNYYYAERYCKNYTKYDLKNWRLPSSIELNNLLKNQKDNITYVNHSYMFYNKQLRKVGNISFDNGSNYNGDEFVFIRCVRDL